MAYIITFKHGRTRRIAMRNDKISHFKTKSSARNRAKEYKGYHPRIAKIKWR